MSGLTIPLWRVMEFVDDPGTGAHIGLDAYPLWKEEERLGINRLIIDHYWNREIGQETISQFVFLLRRTMREIMPTYNQLYQTANILAGRELATYDLTTVRDGTATGSESAGSESFTTASAKAGSTSVFYDTPQVRLAGNKDYATNATDATSANDNQGTATGSSNTETTGTTKDTSRTTGFQGSAADLLNRYRSTIINTDMMLLNDPELATCFAVLWGTNEPIEPPRRMRSLPL